MSLRPQLSGSAILASLIFTASCGSGAPTRPTATQDTGRIVVLGDSLSVSPSPPASFPAVLQQRLDAERRPWRIINAGIRGDSTEGGVERLDRVLAENPDILILALGANDGLRGVPVETVHQNLSAIIERAQRRRAQLLLCGMEAPPFHGLDYTLAFHVIFPDLASRYAVPLVPFLLAGVFGNPALNEPDLIHPNAEGARRIAGTVWPYLLPLLQDPANAQNSSCVLRAWRQPTPMTWREILCA
jgi:acyl-CoA thioesterase I